MTEQDKRFHRKRKKQLKKIGKLYKLPRLLLKKQDAFNIANNYLTRYVNRIEDPGVLLGHIKVKKLLKHNGTMTISFLVSID